MNVIYIHMYYMMDILRYVKLSKLCCLEQNFRMTLILDLVALTLNM